MLTDRPRNILDVDMHRLRGHASYEFFERLRQQAEAVRRFGIQMWVSLDRRRYMYEISLDYYGCRAVVSMTSEMFEERSRDYQQHMLNRIKSEVGKLFADVAFSGHVPPGMPHGRDDVHYREWELERRRRQEHERQLMMMPPPAMQVDPDLLLTEPGPAWGQQERPRRTTPAPGGDTLQHYIADRINFRTRDTIDRVQATGRIEEHIAYTREGRSLLGEQQTPEQRELSRLRVELNITPESVRENYNVD